MEETVSHFVSSASSCSRAWPYGHHQSVSRRFGVLVPWSHAALARSATDGQRYPTFARYSLIGHFRGGAGLDRRLVPFFVHRGDQAFGSG